MLTRKRKRRHLSMTSLIDVIFLLLLFFMLASTFTRFSELEISNVSASAQVAVPQQSDAMNLIVSPTQLTMDGTTLTDSQLIPAVEWRLKNSDRLNLSVAGQTTTQRLTDILVMLEPLDGLQVNLVSPS